MKPHTLAAIVAFAVVVVGYFFHRAAQERAKERAQTQAIEGYDYTVRCECGWEIGADDPRDARDMLTLHLAVKPHPERLDSEWLHLATLALTDWPPMPEDTADLPRTW